MTKRRIRRNLFGSSGTRARRWRGVAATLGLVGAAWLPPRWAAAAQEADAVPAASVVAPKASPKDAGKAPFAFADFSWMPANAAADPVLVAGPLTGEVRLDLAYHYSLHRPQDDTLAGSSSAFRHGELQLTELGLGGNLDYRNVQARIMLQLGLYSTGTPRNDSSVARGQWQLANAYRLLSEAYAGYHFSRLSGINLQAGLFMSYIGLWSYHNADNWTYQPSFVSSNTPWYFSGVRLQIFATDRLKIEPWVINGWQAYGRFNYMPGLGVQVAWRPSGVFGLASNSYVGTDTLGAPRRVRLHTDNSVMWKTFARPGRLVRQGAATFTVDAGCEQGAGVACGNQYFVGAMGYYRVWLGEMFGLTAGGGFMKNPGRYLLLLPPVNAADALSGTPYLPTPPKAPFWAWDAQLSGDMLPVAQLRVRLEYTHRRASEGYFVGRGGITPPGGNQGAAGSLVPGFVPDLRRHENRLTLALLVKL